MGKFSERLKGVFLQEIPQENVDVGAIPAGEDLEQESDYPLEPVNTEDVRQDHLIEDLYKSNGKEDLSRSIFKVDELMKNLPKEMPTATKQTTVLAIMGSFGLDSASVLEDAEERLQVLISARTQITDEHTNSINKNLAVIEQKKSEIEELEKENAYHTETINEASNAIDSEIEIIKKLAAFIGGEN